MKLSSFTQGSEAHARLLFSQGRRIFASTAVAHTSHALSPEAVLQVYRQTEGREPPPAFTLAVRGEAFALGQPPGAGAEAAMDEAMLCLVRLLANPRLDAWQALAA